MKIIIHGTKGGYRVLYPIGGYSPIGDLRFNTIDESSVGGEAYSITFTENECVFSKYKIVRDVNRGISVGYIGFSVLFPNNQKLSGEDTKSLLDQLSNHYCRVYTHNNNLDNIPEDWTFVEKIAGAFTVKNVPSANIENIQKGTSDGAFVYFTSDDELQKYFDKHYLEEYDQFKQVFFVKSDLKGKPENPLNALRHDPVSDLTGKIDLENYPYKLREYHGQGKNGVSIEIRVNGRLKHNGDKIFKKDNISIRYSKNQYYEEINEQGKLTDSKIAQYLKVDEISEKIDVVKDVDLLKITKSLNIEIKDSNGNPVNDAEIKIGYRHWEKVNGNQFSYLLSGEDIKERLTVTAKKESENLFSEYISIYPDSQSKVELVLNKYIVINLIALNKENGNIISNFRYRINDGKGYRDNDTELTFKDNDINKSWMIEISYKEGRDNYSGKIEYCPATGKNPLYVELERTRETFPQNETFSIDAGKHGKKSKNCPDYSTNRNGLDLDKNSIKPDKGYTFIGWDLNTNDNSLIAQYKKQQPFFNNPKVIAGLAIVAIVLAFGIWMLISLIKSNEVEEPINRFYIHNYVNGDTTNLKKLIDYKSNWEKQRPEFSENGGSFLGILQGEEKQFDSVKYKEWEDVMQKIEGAITKRELIDKKDYVELNKLYYSYKHNRVDSTKFRDATKQLGDVSELTLTQIVESINSNLAQNEAEQEQIEMQDKEPTIIETPPPPASQPQAKKKQAEPSAKKKTLQPVQQPVSSDKTAEIIEFLRGSELKKVTLEYYRSQTTNTDLQKSIDLALKLWKIDGTKNKSYSSYQKELNNDKNLKISDLKKLVDNMCSEKSPKYLKEQPLQDQGKNLTQIIDKLK
jgi:hypothetical protein